MTLNELPEKDLKQIIEAQIKQLETSLEILDEYDKFTNKLLKLQKTITELSLIQFAIIVLLTMIFNI